MHGCTGRNTPNVSRLLFTSNSIATLAASVEVGYVLYRMSFYGCLTNALPFCRQGQLLDARSGVRRHVRQRQFSASSQALQARRRASPVPSSPAASSSRSSSASVTAAARCRPRASSSSGRLHAAASAGHSISMTNISGSKKTTT